MQEQKRGQQNSIVYHGTDAVQLIQLDCLPTFKLIDIYGLDLKDNNIGIYRL